MVKKEKQTASYHAIWSPGHLAACGRSVHSRVYRIRGDEGVLPRYTLYVEHILKLFHTSAGEPTSTKSRPSFYVRICCHTVHYNKLAPGWRHASSTMPFAQVRMHLWQSVRRQSKSRDLLLLSSLVPRTKRSPRHGARMSSACQNPASPTGAGRSRVSV